MSKDTTPKFDGINLVRLGEASKGRIDGNKAPLKTTPGHPCWTHYDLDGTTYRGHLDDVGNVILEPW